MAPTHVFEVEYAKSGRAGCKQCKAKIDKDALRVGHKIVSEGAEEGVEDAAARQASHMMESTKWYHRDCFSLMKGKAWFKKNLPESASSCTGFEALKQEDQEIVTAIFAMCKGDSPDGVVADTPTPCRKRGAPGDEQEGSAKKQPKIEAPLAVVSQGVLTDDQFKAFQATKDELAKKSVAQLGALLAKNGLPKSGAKAALVERAAECKALGGVPPVCPTCEKGRLQFSRITGGISCPGFFDEAAGRRKNCKGPSADFTMVRTPWQELF